MPNYVLGWFSGGSVAENTATGSIGFLNLDTGNFPAAIATTMASGPGGAAYSVDPTSFEVTVTGGLNYETTPLVALTILITFTDASDNGSGESLSLSVTDVAEVPDGLSLSASSVAENSATGTVIATLTGTDPDGGVLTYALISGAGFSVVGNELRVAGQLNHEATPTRDVTLSVTDAQSNVAQFTRTITIGNVNEAPGVVPVGGVTTATIGENAAAGRAVGQVTVTDPDVGDSVALSLVGADAGLFVLDGMTVRLASGVTLDHGSAPVLTFSVRGIDNGALQANQAFTVNVADVVTQATDLQAVLGGGNGTAVGLTVTISSEGPVLQLGGSSIVLTGQDTLATADGTLAFGAGTTLAQVERLYLGLAGRAATGTERTNALDALQTGTMADLANSLLRGTEFTTHVQGNSAAQDMDGLSNGQFVDLLYGRVLGRGADSSGLTWWTSELDDGALTRAETAVFSAVSSEGQTLYTNQTRALWAVDAQAYQVRNLYDVALNREPDAGGLAFWRGVLEQGVSMQVVADFIIASTEFQTAVSGLTTGQIVEMFYQNGLERGSDSGGLGFWTAVIDGGLGSLADVLMGFAQSSEQHGQLSSYLAGSDIFV